MGRPKRIYGVYTITCTVNGRQYVGSAANVRNRWGTHKWALRHGHHDNAALQADWSQFGEAAFEFRVVAEIKDHDLRRAAEQACLDEIFASGTAYNRRPNVNNNTGLKFTEEQRIALSMAHRGKTMSPEARASMSEAAKRRYAPLKGTPEMRDQMAAMGRANLGKPKSAEQRANMAAAQRRLTAEQVTQIRSRYAAGGVSQTALAAEYGVHQGTISNIVRGKGYPSAA